MIEFAWPWLFALLPLPWLIGRFLPPARPPGEALFLPFAAALGGTATPAARRLPGVRRILLGLAWLCLLAAAARPQWLGEPQPVASTGRRVLLAVDVSGSMAAQDMAGGYNRLQVVQKIAGDFVARRHGDRVGLILFGSRPYLQAPLSADLATVREFLYQAVVGVAGGATALGDAIGLALKRLDDDKTPGETVLILLTDGANTAGVMPPEQAARLAAAARLRIYSIGVGSPPGVFSFGSGGDLDEDTLKAIAQATGGEYFRAEDAGDLLEVYARIDELEPAAGREQWYRPSEERFHWPLALALSLSLSGVLWRKAGR